MEYFKTKKHPAFVTGAGGGGGTGGGLPAGFSRD